MRKIVFSALTIAFLAACAGFPAQSESEWAAAWNEDPRVWPPVVPGQAFPPQIMDGGGDPD
jgi:hypothetical protein